MKSAPLSQLLRLRRLCGVSRKITGKVASFSINVHGYPVSVVQASYHRVQQIDRQSALQMIQIEMIQRLVVLQFL